MSDSVKEQFKGVREKYKETLDIKYQITCMVLKNSFKG